MRSRVPADHSTISEALAARGTGTAEVVVDVEPGKYAIRDDALGHGARGNDLGVGLHIKGAVHIRGAPGDAPLQLRGGVYVEAGATLILENFSLTNMRPHNLFGFGVLVEAGGSAILKNCKIESGATIGISVYGQAELRGCTITRSQRSGIATHGMRADLVMANGCIVEHNAETGVVVGGGQARLSELVCQHNGDRGVWICGAASALLEFSQQPQHNKDHDQQQQGPPASIHNNAEEGLVAEGDGTIIHVVLQAGDIDMVCHSNGECSQDNVYSVDGGKIHITCVDSTSVAAVEV